MGYIYKITNIINNHSYIGQTCQDVPNKRWKEHMRSIKYGNGCPVLSKAILKYGIENFNFEILLNCTDDNICQYEKEYIKEYNTMIPNGYNIHEGGALGGMFKGHCHTEETKQHLSERSRAYFADPDVCKEHGEKVRKALKMSEKWKLYIKKKSELKGQHVENQYKPTEEHRKNISEGLKKYYEANDSTQIRNENKNKISKIMTEINGRPVNQYSNEGVFMFNFPSVAEGARQNGLTRGNVQACVSGRTKTAGGFIWKYATSK